ncbi:MAG TPA: GAF domain-containing protein [Anaerolineales bacterium]|nr:GAF domain-containing protein [Anaerolineales bacterium]
MKNKQPFSALGISLIYAFIGGTWILLSDRLVTLIFTNPDQLSVIQSYKGWSFVIVTAILLFILLKNRRNTLQAAEQNFSDLFESATEGIFRSSPDGRFLRVNSAMAALYGYESPEDMLNLVHDISSQIHASSDGRRKFTEELTKNGYVKNYNAKNLRKDGSIFWTSTNARVVKDANNQVLYYEGFVTDITQQKKGEQSLKEAEERYRTLVERLPSVIFMDNFNDPQSTQYMSPRLKEILGYTPEEWEAGVNMWEKSLHPEDRERVLAEDARTDKTGEPFRIEYRLRHRDGHYIWIKEDASIIKAEDGTPLFWQGTLLDITEQKNSEKVMKENEISYRELFNSVTQAIYIQDKEGIFLDVNDGAVKMYGYPREYFIGKTPEILSAPGKNDLESLAQKIADTFNGTPQEFEFWGIRSNGQVFPKTVTLNKGTYFGKDVIIAIAQDITTRKQAESLLERQLKELTVLRATTMAGTQSNSEDDMIAQVTQITAEIYTDVCGILLLNEKGDTLTPHPSYIGANVDKWKNGFPVTQGVSGRAVRSGRAIRIVDVTQDVDYIEIDSNTKSEICIPFRVQERIIGVFNVESRHKNAFDEKDERLLNTIAGGLGTAIEKLRLSKAEQVQHQRETALWELIRLANSSLDLNQVLQSILDQLQKVISSDAGSIQLLDKDRLVISAGIGSEILNFSKKGPLLLGKYPLNNYVITEKKPVRLNNVYLDDRFKFFSENSQVLSFMGIPLIVKEKVIGMITLESYQLNHFTKQDEELGLAVANHTSIAIENARLFNEEKRRTQIIETLANIANEIATTREVIPALDKIAERALSLLKASTLAIYLLQDDEKTIKIVTAKGAYQDQLLSHTLEIGKGITGNIIATGRPEIVNDFSQDTRTVTVPGTPKEDARLDTMMSAPLTLHGKSFGAINAWRPKVNGLFDNSELNFLVSIAHQASISIESVRLFEEITRHAQEAAAIAEVGRSISSTLQLNKVLDSIAYYAKELLQAETSAVYLTDPNTPSLRAISALGRESDEIKNDPLKIGNGILGNIALNKQGEIVNNTITDPRSIPVVGTEIERDEHIMGMPFLSKGQLTGLLVVWRVGEDKAFKSTDLDFLNNLAQQATVAIENARLFEAEHKHLQNAEVLNQATSALANTLDVYNLYENILDWLKQLAPYDSASIMMVNSNDTLKMTAMRNIPRHFSIGQIFPLTQKWKAIIESRKPNILDDAQQNFDFQKWTGTEYIRSWMGVAMFIQDKLIGFINLDSKIVGTFTEEHAVLVQTFANQAATALENARLFELEQKRRKESEIMRQATTVLSSLLDLPSLHEAILEWLRKIVPYDSASIMEIEGAHIRITAAKGFQFPEKAIDHTFPIDHVLLKIMNETGEPLIIDDCNKDPRFERWGDAEKVRGWMGVPMITRGQVTGYITIDRVIPNTFAKNDALIAQTFAHQAANSLENTRLYTETLQRLDELEMVSRVSFALRTAHDTREMIPILLNEIKANMGTDSAAIWLYDHGKNELVPIATSGRLKDLPKSTFRPNEGIVGAVYSKGATHVSPELSRDILLAPENASFFGKGWSSVTLPIRTVSETIGVLVVAMSVPHKIGSNHIRLINTLTEIAGNAIYRSNLFERSEEQIRRLTTLREMDTAITSSLDLHITLGILTEHLTTKMGVSAATVLVFNPNSQTLNYHAPIGFKNREAVRGSQNIGDGLAGQILLNRRAIYIKDLNNEPDLPQMKILRTEQFVSYYAMPLFSKGATKGILETYFRHSFTPSGDWLDFIHTLAEQAIIAIDNAQLFENLQRSNQELSLAYDTTLEGWGKALELRDKETKGHTNRVTNLTLELARQMNIPETELLHIRRGALLHDIGKMGVSDAILHKDGPLTQSELFEMRKHPKYAYDLLYPIAYLRPAVDIAYCHHEWWDGSGYPRGLKGEEIPLAARIFAIIDVWDALLSDRPYRKAWSPKKTMKYIKDLSNKQFDPTVVEAFSRMIENDTASKAANEPKKVLKKNPTSRTKKR